MARAYGGGGLPSLEDGVEVASGRKVLGNDTFFKLISFGTLPNATTKSVAHSISGSFVVVDMSFTAANGAAQVSAPFVQSLHLGNDNFMLQLNVDGTNIIIETLEDWSTHTQSQIILEYYKP